MRYEAYQPPLYYLAATPIFWLTDGSLLALRLFGVAIGAIATVLLYTCLALVFPGKTLVPLGAAAFAALLPMHMAMAAAVNNDGMAEMLVLATTLVLLGWMRRHFYAGDGETPPHQTRRMLLLALLLGLGMATKIYAYLFLPVVVLVVGLVTWLRPRLHPGTPDRLQVTPSWRTLTAGVRWAAWVRAARLCIGRAVVGAQRLLVWRLGYFGACLARSGGRRPAAHHRLDRQRGLDGLWRTRL